MKISSLISFIREFFRVTWYSVSSQKFYPDLYTKYKGYGVKYIATIISFTSLIYVLLSYGDLMIVKNYLAHPDKEDNPIEFMIRQWPEISYAGGSISWEEDEPLLITNQAGKTVIAIDPEGKLSEGQLRKIPVLFRGNSIRLSLEKEDDQKSAKPKEVSISYKKIFGKEDMLVNSDGLRERILSMVDSFNIFILILVLPLVIAIRLALHIFGNLFGILILYVIFIWMGMRPTIKSASRVMLFASGGAEVAAAMLILVVPQMIFLSSMIKYWAIILAIYTITKYCNTMLHSNKINFF